MGKISLGGIPCLEGLLIAEGGLTDLQGDFLLSVIEFQALDIGLDLCCLNLVAQPSPMPKRHPEGSAHAEGGAETVFKAIIAVGIGGMEGGHSGEFGHHLAAGDLYLLVIYLGGQFQ